MIVSAHRLTGFWFEPQLNKGPDVTQQAASRFLTSALDTLRQAVRSQGQLKAAISTGFDPARLSSNLSGHLWLSERLQWMKQNFPDFDDVPGGKLKDPAKRRSPFPAFHSTIRYSVCGDELPLAGVQVLLGHDFAVIHEFTISPEQLAVSELGLPLTESFATSPEPSVGLFTATISQISNERITLKEGWKEAEFSSCRCPGVKQDLSCAMRGDERSYQGLVMGGGTKAGHEANVQIKDHIHATAYLTFLSTLLVNDSKVQYECQVAAQQLEALERSLDIRCDDAEALLSQDQQPVSKASLNALNKAHLTDRKSLDRFDQLVDTCALNKRQFERVAGQIVDPANLWVAISAKRMGDDIENLLVAQRNLRARFDTTKAFLDGLRNSIVDDKRTISARGSDSQLEILRQRLRLQFRECNDYCKGLKESGYRRMFEPSQEALDDFFEYEIHIPVTSARDFRGFITTLYWVFDEGLLETIRRPNPRVPLLDPLVRVTKVLDGKTFTRLSTLRNKLAAHDAFKERGVDGAKNLSEVYESLIGVRTIRPFEAQAWLSLQTAVLEMLSRLLEELLGIFADHQENIRKGITGTTESSFGSNEIDLVATQGRDCLTLLKAVVPYQYAQWLIEDPDSHDYRVIASVIPDGATGYDIAHRTGVIGQVFRLKKAILIPNVRNHPLYDPFDEKVEWELCFPIFSNGQIYAVVNLEGSGPISVKPKTWSRVSQIVKDVTHCETPAPGKAKDSYLIETVSIMARTIPSQDRYMDILDVARALATAGNSTLLVGYYPDLLLDRGPNMMEASEQGLTASYCYFGVEPGLDLLATGPKVSLSISKMDWWKTSNGRYAFVLVQDEDTSGQTTTTHL